jgi:hypothetical protein
MTLSQRLRGLFAPVWRAVFFRNADQRFREFADTEAYGARDLAHAASLMRDPWLRRQLLRHAQDEVRHARILDEGAARPAVRGVGASVLGGDPAEAGLDLEQLGEVRFLAFVHLAEKRAVEEFTMHRAALGAEGAHFDGILDDEKRHVAWTGHALERFRKEGRGAEVDEALRALARERWRNALLSVTRRVSEYMSVVVLLVLYVVLLGPFRLLAGAWRTGWAPATRGRLERAF